MISQGNGSRNGMRRSLRPIASLLLAVALVGTMGGPVAAGPATGPEVTVKARLEGWAARRDGYHLYREGSTVRLVVVVRPDLSGAEVRARLEWRRPGSGWRLLDASSTTLGRRSRQRFRVEGLPGGYSFRIMGRVPPGQEHGPGRSPWRYFRVR